MRPEPESVARGEQMVLLVELKGSGTCHICQSPIAWARTIDGKMMPLESELRVRAITSPEMRKRITLRIAKEPGTTSNTERVRNPEHELQLLAKGWSVREELALVWEIPASLTHWPNCRGRKPVNDFGPGSPSRRGRGCN